ncbi:MAG: helix-turn-helix domain-containing protein [Pseudonocardiaceae bacterium]
MTDGEHATSVPGVVLWRRTFGSTPERARILPDGCLDLLWDGRRLFVAGPDTAARWHQARPGVSYVGLRCSGGIGPVLLGVPADELRDRTPDLDELWPSDQARRLAERVAADPTGGLKRWAVERAAIREVDPLGPRVLQMASAAAPVAVMADRLGLSARHLHRRCLPIFGYGPQRLARILRLSRALDEARAGVPLAQVAAGCGYADQAHLSREVRALAGTTPRELLGELAPRSSP